MQFEVSKKEETYRLENGYYQMVQECEFQKKEDNGIFQTMEIQLKKIQQIKQDGIHRIIRIEIDACLKTVEQEEVIENKWYHMAYIPYGQANQDKKEFLANQ